MPEITAEEAAGRLKVGAVGVGEDHESALGRDLVLQLINAGLVKNLFVELAPGAYGGMLANALEKHKQGLGLDEIKAGLPPGQFSCSVTLADVIAAAIVKGIPVHLADHWRGNDARSGHKPVYMGLRNENVATKFSEITGSKSASTEGAIGSLILFGAAHFEAAPSNNKPIDGAELINGLPWVKCG